MGRITPDLSGVTFEAFIREAYHSGIGTLGDRENVCTDCGSSSEWHLADPTTDGEPFCVPCVAASFAATVFEVHSQLGTDVEAIDGFSQAQYPKIAVAVARG